MGRRADDGGMAGLFIIGFHLPGRASRAARSAWTPARSARAAGAGSSPGVTAAFARRSPAAVAIALATVYLVWGSTYLAIRVTDRTMPPFLMSSVRFLIAGVGAVRVRVARACASDAA